MPSDTSQWTARPQSQTWEYGFLVHQIQAEGCPDLSQGRENEMRTDTELQTCLTISDMSQGSPKAGPSPKIKVGSENMGRSEVLQAFLHL